MRNALAQLLAVGVALSHRLQDAVETELRSAVSGLADAPFSSVVLWLFGWFAELKSKPETVRVASALMALVNTQSLWASYWATSETKRSVILAAKRLFKLTVRGDFTGEWTDFAEHLLRKRSLPSPECSPESPDAIVGGSTIAEFVRHALRFTSRQPIVPIEPNGSPFNEQSSDGAGSPLDHSCSPDHLRPLLSNLLRLAQRGPSYLSQQDAQCLVIALLEGLYGLTFKAALTLSTDPACTRLRAGNISQTTLTLLLAGGFFRGADCWAPSSLTLPLVTELSALLAYTGVTYDSGCSLGEQYGRDFSEHYAAWVREKHQAKNTGSPSKQVSFAHTFAIAALIYCDVEPAVLSLLLGRPVYGSRGRSAYVMRTAAQLRLILTKIQASVYLLCGVTPSASPPLLTDPEEQHGTPSDSYAVLVEQFAQCVESATSPTELTLCVEHLMLLLGKRRSRMHPNPAWFYRSFLTPSLTFGDKPWISGQTHSVPCPEEMGCIFQECARIFGESRQLIYGQPKNEGGPSKGTGVAPTIPLSSGQPWQPARTSMINRLIDHGVSTVVIDYIVGQHSAGMAPVSGALTLTRAQLESAALVAVQLLLSVPGFKRALAALYEKLVALPPVRIADSAEVISDRFVSPTTNRVTLETGPIPLSYEEDQLAQTLVRGFVHRHGAPNARASKQPADIIVATALSAGIPLSHLRRYAAYLHAANFVLSGEIPLVLCPVPTEDAGGLAILPIVLDDHYGLTRMVQCVLQSRRLDYQKRGVMGGSAAGVRLFPKVQDADIAAVVRTALKNGGLLVEIDDAQALRLLERATEAICRFRHPGPVWAVMTRKMRSGLNHFRTTDCLKSMGLTSRLTLLDGSVWIAPSADAPKSNHAIGGSEASSSIAGRLAHFARRKGIPPSWNNFHQLAAKRYAGKPNTGKYSRLLIARSAMEYCRRMGWLEVSTPERLLDRLDVERAIGALSSAVLESKPKKKSTANADPALQRLRKKGQLFVAVAGVFEAYLRPAEAVVCPVPTRCGDNPDRRFIMRFQKGGKASERYVDTAFLKVGNLPQVTWGPEVSADVATPGYAQAKIAIGTLRRTLAVAFGEPITAYDVRHWGVFENIMRLYTDATERPGSLYARAEYLAMLIGQSTITVAPCSYAGVLLCALSVQAGNLDHKNNNVQVCSGMLTPEKLVLGVSDDSELRKAHAMEIALQERAANREVFRFARNENSTCERIFPTVITSQDSSPAGSEDAIVVEFPAGPDAKALSEAIERIWMRARGRAIDVIFSLYESKNIPMTARRMSALANAVESMAIQSCGRSCVGV